MTFYHIVVAALGCFILLVAAILLGREAYRRGQGQAQPMLDQLRADYAYALEQQDERHREQLEEQRADYQRQFRQLNNLLQETRSTATAAQAEYGRLHDELAAKLQATQAAALSATEIQLLEDMTAKLRLASPVLHAQQQFADARMTKELAGRGEVLLSRLRPLIATGEDAA